MNKPESCTIVLPCFNPQPNWAERVIQQYKAISAGTSIPVDIVLVNDGSSKGILGENITLLKKEITAFQYISFTDNKGKGYALREGVKHAQGKIIIYTDIDFPYTTESLLQVLDELMNSQCDIAVGIKNKKYYEHVPAARRSISKMLRGMIGLFFNIPITDTQCGLKGFNINVKETFIGTTIDRYLFDLQFIHNAHKKGYKLKPIEIQLNHNVVFSKMNYKVLLPELANFLKIVLRKQ